MAVNPPYNTRLSYSLGFYFLKNLRGYRLFVHIAADLGGFMFTKRANRGAMRKFVPKFAVCLAEIFRHETRHRPNWPPQRG